MNDSPAPGPAPKRAGFGQRLAAISVGDGLMLALAVISIGLLSYETWGPATEPQRRAIVLADLAVCGVFALEFLWRWSREGWTGGFVLRNWYDVLGMIPLAHPVLRGFRLFRLLRIVILLSRVGMATDRALGDEFTYRLIRRFKNNIVEALSGPVTVAVLGEVEQVLQKGQYTRNLARAFDENQAELRRMVIEKLREDPQLRRLSRLPFYGDLSEAMVGITLRVFRQFLDDPRTDELVADVLRENLQQIRQAVAQKEAGRRAGDRH